MTRSHPYRGLPDFQFWPRAVTWVPPGGLDPVVGTRFTIGADDRVATMGSCFAQHLSRHLSVSGLNYFVAETAPSGMEVAEARRRNYGTFSARYGNVYTVAQAVQLFRRAFGDYEPAEKPWDNDGAFVDPFRPQVEPEGYLDEESLREDQARHLAATRTVFERCDVLVFTLGLTEAWRSRDDGAIFPTAPGVAGGQYDPSAYEFVNFGIDEVRRDLLEFCTLARSVNPGLRVLLTVSPVPLVATYEPRHVLVSTTCSKAVLRVAADEAYTQLDFVDYFPSYEIVSTASSPRNYYADDLREVDESGVAHVMRCFSRHYVEGRDWSAFGGELQSAPTPGPVTTDIICDEEAIAAAIEASR
jgi:GSCFA family